MAIYDYQCEKCGEIEIEHKITENVKRKCPDCGAKVKRVISKTAFQGMGFAPHKK